MFSYTQSLSLGVFWPNPAKEGTGSGAQRAGTSQSRPQYWLSSVWLLSWTEQHPAASSHFWNNNYHYHTPSLPYSAVDIIKTEQLARCDIWNCILAVVPNLVNRKSICCPVRLETWSNSVVKISKFGKWILLWAGREDKSKHHQTWSSSNLPIEWTSQFIQARRSSGVGCGKNKFEI